MSDDEYHPGWCPLCGEPEVVCDGLCERRAAEAAEDDLYEQCPQECELCGRLPDDCTCRPEDTAYGMWCELHEDDSDD
jgi:hypothetical protein